MSDDHSTHTAPGVSANCADQDRLRELLGASELIVDTGLGMVTKRRQDRHARKTESLRSGLGVLHFPRLSPFHLLLYLSSVKGQINKLVESIQRLNLPFGINLSDRTSASLFVDLRTVAQFG